MIPIQILGWIRICIEQLRIRNTGLKRVPTTYRRFRTHQMLSSRTYVGGEDCGCTVRGEEQRG